MMFAVCISSFVFIFTSSFAKMPISGTHTVIGSFLGTGLYVCGAENLNWQKLSRVVISWFLSPVLSACIAFILILTVSALIMDTVRFRFATRLFIVQLLTAFSFLATTFVLKNLLKFDFVVQSKNSENAVLINLIITGASLVLGTIGCRLIMLGVLLSHSQVTTTKK